MEALRAKRFSIVIASDGRAASLAETLRSLGWLDGPDFEVIVVPGPSEDGAVLAAWAGAIKVARNPARNLSRSRNIGIGLAAGEIVAFLDDDAIPEPEWLLDLSAAYDRPEVGGAGGSVYGPDGRSFVYRYVTLDRLGEANFGWRRPTPELSFPYSAAFPHLLGTNCSFRRAALVAAGGFDEEFAYYLDESDLCCRLIDRGWEIRQLERALVHHRQLPSAFRTKDAIVRDWYPVIKNMLYFALLNGRAHHPMDAIIGHVAALVERYRRDVAWAIGEGLLGPEERGRFAREVAAAWEDGLRRGIAGRRELPVDLGPPRAPFRAFPRLVSPGAETIVLLGSARARGPGLARGGAHVHAVEVSAGEAEGTAFQEGVWTHRVHPAPDRAAALVAEVTRISRARPIAYVWAPEEADRAALRGRFRLRVEAP